MKTKKQSADWLLREMEKDKQELEREKKKLIKEILRTKPEDLVQKIEKPKKLTLWERIKKAIMG